MRQAGLFSAVASAFIIQVQPQLQPDPSEETAALLRVLLYKLDNTTFGNEIPVIPQWTGPPSMIVQAQAMLYASLAASLFSAFFAMLGKQWLNRYDSSDMRGSAMERSRHRQGKHNGIITWHFNYVMESLPLILQVALLLLGCALSLYLWEINSTITFVVLGVTSFGVLFYIFIALAATASASCPYQTPGSRTLRLAVSALLAAVSACSSAVSQSHTAIMLRSNVEYHQPLRSRNQVMPFLKDVACEVPRMLVVDTFHLGRAVFWPFAAFVRGMYMWSFRTISMSPEREFDGQTTVLDLECISWALHKSLDKTVHLVTLEYFATAVTLAGLNPNLIADCFNILIDCLKIVSDEVVVTPGLERLAAVSAAGLLRTFTHLSTTNPTSRVLADIHQSYTRAFSPEISFGNLQFSHTFGAIHSLFYRHRRYWWVHQAEYRPSVQEHILVTHALTQLAQSRYRRRGGRKKVPRWILSFAMQSLSLNPQLPISATVDSLSIVAIDLGCDISNARAVTLDKRCVHILRILIPLTRNKCPSGKHFRSDNSKT